MEHIWIAHTSPFPYVMLEGHKDAFVRTVQSPNGQYLWQFREVCSYARSIKEAKDFVEAGAEYFDVMRRNPYRVPR